MTDSTEQTPQRDPVVQPEAMDSERSLQVPFTGTEDEFLAHYWSFVGESSPTEMMWRSPAQFNAPLQPDQSSPIQPKSLFSRGIAFLFSQATLTRFGVFVIAGVLIIQIACNLSLRGIKRASKP
jgi:hypothetical protein